MTTKEIATMIGNILIPVTGGDPIPIPSAYYQFDEETAKEPPFICFFYPDNNDFIADNKNYKTVYRLVIELYTDNKDFAAEAAVESALTAAGLVYTRAETKLDDERMYEVIFSTEVLIDA